MKIFKKNKGSFAVVLAMLVLVSGLCLNSALGAEQVSEETGTLTLTVEGQAFADSLTKLNLTADLTQVAVMTKGGTLSVLDAYKSAVDASKITDKTTADEWSKMAEDAAAVDGSATVEGVEITEGTSEATQLPVGLYLVEVDYIEDAQYGYTFAPFLISVPDNNYGRTDADGETIEDDSWVYDVTAYLKASREQLYGDLTIEKYVSSYGDTEGEADFIFTAEWTEQQADATGGMKTVEMKKVLTTSHNEAGHVYAVLEHIPATAVVTITEENHPDYVAVTGTNRSITIVAESQMKEGDNIVSFENKTNTGDTQTRSIENHFIYKGTTSDGKPIFDWEQVTRTESKPM